MSNNNRTNPAKACLSQETEESDDTASVDNHAWLKVTLPPQIYFDEFKPNTPYTILIHDVFNPREYRVNAECVYVLYNARLISGDDSIGMISNKLYTIHFSRGCFRHAWQNHQEDIPTEPGVYDCELHFIRVKSRRMRITKRVFIKIS